MGGMFTDSPVSFSRTVSQKFTLSYHTLLITESITRTVWRFRAYHRQP